MSIQKYKQDVFNYTSLAEYKTKSEKDENNTPIW